MLISAPVLCLVCQQRSTRLERHLRRVHAMTVERYKASFPALDAPIVVLEDTGVVINGRVQLPPGARRCDGRDADRARQYQRDRRARGSQPAPPPAPPIERDPAEEAARSAMISDLIRRYLDGSLSAARSP